MDGNHGKVQPTVPASRLRPETRKAGLLGPPAVIQPQALCSCHSGQSATSSSLTAINRNAPWATGRPGGSEKPPGWPAGWGGAGLGAPGSLPDPTLFLYFLQEKLPRKMHAGHWIRTLCWESKCRRKKHAHLRSRQGQVGVRQASTQPTLRTGAQTPPHPEETGKELTVIVTSSASCHITQQPPPLRSHRNLFVHPTDSHRAALRCQPRSRHWETTEVTRMF